MLKMAYHNHWQERPQTVELGETQRAQNINASDLGAIALIIDSYLANRQNDVGFNWH